MNPHNNISHTGEKNFQNASPREDPSIREAAEQANEPIHQQETHPDIQHHLVEALGNIVGLEALSIAEGSKVDTWYRLWTAKLVQDAIQRDTVYLSIAQDSKECIDDRLEAAKFVQDVNQHDAVYLSIAQDPRIYINYRLKAAELIKDPTQRDTAYLSIVQGSKECIDDRLEAVERIQDATQHDTVDAVCFSIAQDPTVNSWSRLKAAKLIKDDNQRDTAYLSIAQDPVVGAYNGLKAARQIVEIKIQEEFYPSIIKTIFCSDILGHMHEIIDFAKEISYPEIKNLVIKTLCQNWPLVKEELFRNHLAAFCNFYELASCDAVRAELITAIVVRTDLDAAFRKAVVEEHVQDPEERECLVKVIEEKQEGSLKGSRTKRSR